MILSLKNVTILLITGISQVLYLNTSQLEPDEVLITRIAPSLSGKTSVAVRDPLKCTKDYIIQE